MAFVISIKNTIEYWFWKFPTFWICMTLVFVIRVLSTHSYILDKLGMWAKLIRKIDLSSADQGQIIGPSSLKIVKLKNILTLSISNILSSSFADCVLKNIYTLIR